jgi:CheY-like chemotaxis protein
MKVLLVDDEADVCRLVKTMVEPLGVEVRTCSDSREAASILETEKFDGIMLDVAMPNLDGIELTRKIRTTPLNQQAPIIMITGMDDVDTMRRAFEAGATFFIGKPFSREKVYAIFRSARGLCWRNDGVARGFLTAPPSLAYGARKGSLRRVRVSLKVAWDLKVQTRQWLTTSLHWNSLCLTLRGQSKSQAGSGLRRSPAVPRSSSSIPWKAAVT